MLVLTNFDIKLRYKLLCIVIVSLCVLLLVDNLLNMFPLMIMLYFFKFREKFKKRISTILENEALVIELSQQNYYIRMYTNFFNFNYEYREYSFTDTTADIGLQYNPTPEQIHDLRYILNRFMYNKVVDMDKLKTKDVINNDIYVIACKLHNRIALVKMGMVV